jgi:hypothetical protein
MSRKTVSAVIGSFLAVGFALGTVQGCGSSSSGSGSFAETCMQGCAKIIPCEAALGYTQTMAACVQSCTDSAKTSTGGACTNAAAMQSAANACLSKTACVDLLACGAAIPPCEGGGTGGSSGTGTGGTTGAAGAHGTGGATGAAGAHGTGGATATGGTSGAAGGSGSAGCASCDKAQTCCLALAALLGQPTTSCTFSTASCSAATGTTQSTDISTCQQILTSCASLSASCK